MKAAFFSAVNKVELIELEEPSVVKPDDVKIRIKATGICASDVSGLKGNHPTRKPPVISGHESSGVVVEVGSGVKDFKPGDRVAIEPHYGCMKCPACLSGAYNVCPDKKVLGTIYWSGSFAEYIIAPERTLIHLPEEMSFEEGALLEPFAVGVHATRMSAMSLGKTAVVIGSGPIGISCMLGAKMAGAGKTIMLDISDFALETARKMGADCTINVQKEDGVARVLEETGGEGADVIYMAVPLTTILDDAILMTRRNGQIMEVAHFGKIIPSFDTTKFRWKQLNLQGSYMYVKKDYEICVKAITDGTVNVKPMITKVADVEDCVEIFDIAKNRTEDYVKIIFRF